MSVPTFAEYLEAGGQPPSVDELYDAVAEILPIHFEVSVFKESRKSDPKIWGPRFEIEAPFEMGEYGTVVARASIPGWPPRGKKSFRDDISSMWFPIKPEQLIEPLQERFGFQWMTSEEATEAWMVVKRRENAAVRAETMERNRQYRAEQAARELEETEDDEPPHRATMPTGPAPTVGRTWRNIFPACVTRAAEVGLSHKDVVVLGVLLSFQNTKKDDPKYLQMYPGITRLCNAMGKTTAKEISSYKPSVYRSIEALKDAGALIEVRAPRKNQTSGHYKLGWPLDSWHPATVDAPSTVEEG